MAEWTADQILAGAATKPAEQRLRIPTIDSIGEFDGWYIHGRRAWVLSEGSIGSYRVKIFDVGAGMQQLIHGVVYRWDGSIVSEWIEPPH